MEQLSLTLVKSKIIEFHLYKLIQIFFFYYLNFSRILSDVQCIFTPALGTVMHSRLSYYKFTTKASSVNVYELLELSKTDSAFDGNLDSNQSLTVVGKNITKNLYIVL